MERLTVNSIRNIIGLQWNVKVKDILPDLTKKTPDLTSEDSDNPSEETEKTISRIQCRIKGMNGVKFSLELTSGLNVVAKGHSRWSYKVMYAFAVVKDRAFLVKGTDNLKFLDILKAPYLDSAEEVVFYCLVLVGTPVADSTSAVMEIADKIKVVPTDEQVCADSDGTGHSHCKFDGEIPEFTVDKAKELISAEDTNSVLKVLAMEYLRKSIKVDNVSDILKIAIDQDHKVLMRQCSEFLNECVVRQISSSDSSDSADY